MSEQIPQNLVKVIRLGEGVKTEFKTAEFDLPSSLFESICGMLNREGGHIFLGINDNGNTLGINEQTVQRLKRDFVNQCNNPQKISPTARLEIKKYTIDNKTILYIYVYESSDVHKTKGKIFDRNEDGDFDITNNTTLVAQLYLRKDSTYIENKIFPYAKITDLR